jgi:hypothetical protein
MARIGYCLLLVVVVGWAAAPLRAQAPAAPAPSSSLTPEKMMAKEKAVEEHAKKHAECKKQSKEAGLGFIARKKFVSDCMAAK